MSAAILQAHQERIEEVCRRFHVRRLDAFGSVLRDDFGSASDVDFLVEFERDEDTNAFSQYFGLKEALGRLLDREVELVCYAAIRNPVFKREVDSTRSRIYVA